MELAELRERRILIFAGRAMAEHCKWRIADGAARFVRIGMEELVSERQAFEGNAAAPGFMRIVCIAQRLPF